MGAESQSLDRPREHFRRRAFRPFFLWLPFAVLLILADAHLRLIKNTRIYFTVAVEGHSVQSDYKALLNSLPVRPGQQVEVGSYTFLLAVANAQSVEKSCFIWHGSNYLGDFNLTADKGTLRVNADPLPNSIQVAGGWVNVIGTTNHPLFPNLPVGEYSVTANYPWLHYTDQVRVTGSTLVGAPHAFTG